MRSVEDPPIILLVDQNARNIEVLTAFLGDSGFKTLSASDLAAFDDVLASGRAEEASLAMVDLHGFDATIWDRCRLLHELGVAFVVIGRTHSPAAQQMFRRQSHRAGARHTLTKPLRKEQLLTLVRILTETDD